MALKFVKVELLSNMSDQQNIVEENDHQRQNGENGHPNTEDDGNGDQNPNGNGKIEDENLNENGEKEEEKQPAAAAAAAWELSQNDHLNKKLLTSFLEATKGKDLLATMTKNKPSQGSPGNAEGDDPEWND